MIDSAKLNWEPMTSLSGGIYERAEDGAVRIFRNKKAITVSTLRPDDTRWSRRLSADSSELAATIRAAHAAHCRRRPPDKLRG